MRLRCVSPTCSVRMKPSRSACLTPTSPLRPKWGDPNTWRCSCSRQKLAEVLPEFPSNNPKKANPELRNKQCLSSMEDDAEPRSACAPTCRISRAALTIASLCRRQVQRVRSPARSEACECGLPGKASECIGKAAVPALWLVWLLAQRKAFPSSQRGPSRCPYGLQRCRSARHCCLLRAHCPQQCLSGLPLLVVSGSE